MRVAARFGALAVALVAAAMVAALLIGGSTYDAAEAAPARVTMQTPTDPPTAPPTTATPSLPSKPQRGADSLIAVFLLVTLAGALVAVATTSRWNHRTRDGAEPTGS